MDPSPKLDRYKIARQLTEKAIRVSLFGASGRECFLKTGVLEVAECLLGWVALLVETCASVTV